jgi:membrane carboxypeptidase/penicillin-binding protein
MLGCRVRADAPLADVAALARPDAPALMRHLVDGHPFPLGPRNPSWRPLPSLPLPVVRAFLVAEDGRFFTHHGFDLDRIGRALAADLGAGRVERGASTITQQVAKNLWLVEGHRTVARKIEEAVLAWRLEQVLGKRRILELYLNLVELGPGVYGLADAAERYFGKLPDELSADEAAQLAALLPAPRRGMDAAWHKRYRALAARLPTEKVPLFPGGVGPRSSLAVRLSRR